MLIHSLTTIVMAFNICLALTLLICASSVLSADITPVQFRKSQQIIRDICQARFGVTDAEIQAIRSSPDSFDDDSQEKCYATCVLEMLNLIIGGQIPTELAHKTIHLMLPDELKDITIEAMEKCRSFVFEDPSNAHCIVGHAMFKCLTDNNLHFFFV